jgi:hypothetical protein
MNYGTIPLMTQIVVSWANHEELNLFIGQINYINCFLHFNFISNKAPYSYLDNSIW